MNSILTAADVLRPFSVEEFGAFTPLHRQGLAFAAVYAASLDRTPSESGTRKVAAHNVAGHAVVARALGYSINGVRVGLHPQLRMWSGRAAHHVPGEQSGVCIPADQPAVAERIATVDLAGWIAEARCGPVHSNSCLGERYRAALACAAVDDAAGCTAGTTLTGVVNRARAIIERNVTAIDAMVGLLLREKRPGRHRLDEALRSIRQSCDIKRTEAMPAGITTPAHTFPLDRATVKAMGGARV